MTVIDATHPADEVHTRRWQIVIVTAGIALAIASLIYTTSITSDVDPYDELGYNVWQLLAALQFIVWAALAAVNLDSYTRLRQIGSAQTSPLVFLAVTYGGIFFILGAAGVLGITASEGSSLGFAGNALQIGGALSVLPALLALHRLRSIATVDSYFRGEDAGLGLMRFLRRRLGPATASVGVVIGLALIATSQARSISEDPGDQPVVLLYGAFFTGVLFAIFVWVDIALNVRSRRLIDAIQPTRSPRDWKAFEEAEGRRAKLETAYGVGKTARESFEGTVAIAAPLIAALTAYAIG